MCSMLRNAGGRRRAPRARVVAALVLQRGRHERRQRQRRMMGVGAVVKRFELLGARIDLAEVEVARLLRQRAAPPAGRVARLREGQRPERGEADRKRVVEGKSVSVRVDPGGRRIIKKKKKKKK